MLNKYIPAVHDATNADKHEISVVLKNHLRGTTDLSEQTIENICGVRWHTIEEYVPPDVSIERDDNRWKRVKDGAPLYENIGP